jgi:hypothetical protein
MLLYHSSHSAIDWHGHITHTIVKGKEEREEMANIIIDNIILGRKLINSTTFPLSKRMISIYFGNASVLAQRSCLLIN